MAITRRGVDPNAMDIPVFADELKSVEDYQYLKKLSETTGKPLRILRREEVKPPNALVVQRNALKDSRTYEALKKQCEKENKVLWIESEDGSSTDGWIAPR